MNNDYDDMPSFDSPHPPPKEHNLPDPVTLAAEAQRDLAKWLSDHPVITSEDEARQGKLVYDRAKASLGDLEASRDKESKPLYDSWQAVLDKYREPQRTFGTLVKNLFDRLQDFAKKMKKKREDEAAEAQRKLDEAARIAREAEAAEKDKIENAAMGEIGVDIAGAIKDADTAFDNYKRAEHEAARADKAVNVRIGGGFGQTMGIKVEKMQIITDVHAAIKAMGVTEDIKAAVLKSARAYKKLHNKWPEGITEETK